MLDFLRPQNRRNFIRTGARAVAKLSAVGQLANLGELAGVSSAKQSRNLLQAPLDPRFAERVKMLNRVKTELEASFGMDADDLSMEQIIFFAGKMSKLIFNPSLTEPQARRSIRSTLGFLKDFRAKLLEGNVEKLFEGDDDEIVGNYFNNFGLISGRLCEILANCDAELVRDKENRADEFNIFSVEAWLLQSSLAQDPDFDLERASAQMQIFVDQYFHVGEVNDEEVEGLELQSKRTAIRGFGPH